MLSIKDILSGTYQLTVLRRPGRKPWGTSTAVPTEGRADLANRRLPKDPTQIAECKATFILYGWGGLPTTTPTTFTASKVQQTSENSKWSPPGVKCEQHWKPTYQLWQHPAGMVSPSWRTHLTQWRTPQSSSKLGSQWLRPKGMTVTFMVCFTVHQSAMLGGLKPPGSVTVLTYWHVLVSSYVTFWWPGLPANWQNGDGNTTSSHDCCLLHRIFLGEKTG